MTHHGNKVYIYYYYHYHYNQHEIAAEGSNCMVKIVFRKDMFYGWHVLWEDIFIFLWEDMSCRRSILVGGHFLLENMSYGRICRTAGCLIGGHVLWEDMSYRRICHIGRHVLQDDVFLDGINITGRIYNWRICITRGRDLLEDMCYWSTCFTGGHVLLD